MKKPKVYRKGDVIGTVKDKNLLKAIRKKDELHYALWASVMAELKITDIDPQATSMVYTIDMLTGVVTCLGERIYI